MNKETQNFTTVRACDIYTQGAMANHTGSMNETNVNDSLIAIGLSPEKHKYKSAWSTTRLSEVDCHLPELGICAEYKYQKVPGTADQKGGTELLNAAETIECDDYVLVFSGPHWTTPRGVGMFDLYKRSAAKFNKHPETWCVAAKRLHVMMEDEFVEFVEQRKKEKLQNE